KRSRSRRHSRIRFTNDAPKELRRSLTRRLMTSKEISRNLQHRLAAGLEMYSSSHQPDIGYVGSRSETAQQVLTFVLLAVGTNGDRTASRGRLGHVSCHRLSILPAGQHCVLFENSSASCSAMCCGRPPYRSRKHGTESRWFRISSCP